jgi:ATP-dependent DNA helicase 2 subunit 1
MLQMVMEHGGDILAEYRYFGPTDQRRDEQKDRFFTFTEFGGEKIPMTEADKVAVKIQGNTNKEFASLTVFGFKPLCDIPFHHTTEAPYFCYPNEDDCTGSTTAFVNLHAAMVRKKVLAVGELLTRVTAASRMVCIRPLTEDIDEDGEVRRPAGMLVTSLPFEDELRAIPTDACVDALKETGTDIASDELIDAASKLIQKQTLVDVEIGEVFQNPYFTRLWNYVERVALDEPTKTETVLDTELDKDQVLKLAGHQLRRFLEVLPDDIKPEKAVRKRKMEPDDSGVDWHEVFVTFSVAQCKNEELKKKLRSLGESVSGNKILVSLAFLRIIVRSICWFSFII